jgi:hemerythrin-like domain-containing protein
MNDTTHRSSDSVDDALRADHERLDALLVKLKAAVSSGSAAAPEDLNVFSRALAHHMTWEDERLFPAVKSVAGAKECRSIESLEIDHERLRDTVRSLESTIAAADYGTARSLVHWLGTLLQGHNYDEEHGVYVEADRLLGAAERRGLIDQFMAGRHGESP